MFKILFKNRVAYKSYDGKRTLFKQESLYQVVLFSFNGFLSQKRLNKNKNDVSIVSSCGVKTEYTKNINVWLNFLEKEDFFYSTILIRNFDQNVFYFMEEDLFFYKKFIKFLLLKNCLFYSLMIKCYKKKDLLYEISIGDIFFKVKKKELFNFSLEVSWGSLEYFFKEVPFIIGFDSKKDLLSRIIVMENLGISLLSLENFLLIESFVYSYFGKKSSIFLNRNLILLKE